MQQDVGPTESKPRLAGELLLLLLLASLWGASYSFIKVGVSTIPPVTLIAARTLIAGLLLLAVMQASGTGMPSDGATWRKLLVQACLNSVLPFTLIAWAQQSVDASLAAILNSTTPVFAFLITWTLTGHDPANARKLLGVVAGLAGICLVIGPEALGGMGEAFWAQLAIVAATLAYAGAAIFGQNFRNLHPMAPAAGSLLLGAAILIPLSLVIDQPWTLRPSAQSVLALLGLSVFSTALAFTIYFRLIRTLGSVGTTAQAYLRVPIGVGIGALALGESLNPTSWLGLILVVAGVALMTLPKRAFRAARADDQAA